MAEQVPPSCVGIEDACNKANVNHTIMGIVTDLMPPSRTGGTDHMITFTVMDNSGRKARVRYFHKELTGLPAIQHTSDIVLLHHIRYKEYKGAFIFLSNHSTSWTVFHSGSIPQSSFSESLDIPFVSSTLAPDPTPQEKQYAHALAKEVYRGSYDDTIAVTEAQAQPSFASGPRDKFSLLEDITANTYHDLTGQVVKSHQVYERIELYITDYTANPLFFDYGQVQEGREGDKFGYQQRANSKWPGPWGKHTLCVTLWEPHSGYALAKVKEKDFVELRNVHCKLGRDVSIERLEGAIHTDKKYPERVDISLVYPATNEHAKNVLRRKQEYEKKFKSQNRERIEDHPENKQANNQKKATARNRKRQEQMNQAEQDFKTAEPNVSLDSRAEIRRQKNTINKRIKSTNPDTPVCSLATILDTSITHAYSTPGGNHCTLPFQNLKRRTTVRVLDFFPAKLTDFAVRIRNEEMDILKDEEADQDAYPESSPEPSDADCDSCNESEADDSDAGASSPASSNAPSRHTHRWEWRFALLVEDAISVHQRGVPHERAVVYVIDGDAEYLLKMTARK